MDTLIYMLKTFGMLNTACCDINILCVSTICTKCCYNF